MRLSLLLAPLSAAVAAAGSCEVYGQAGDCLPTADCAAEGKVSTPNFCPSDPQDVQCCTATAVSANSCRVNNEAGECLPTADCAAEGKVSTPHFCPNDPKDVQCCTSAPSPETLESNSCEVNNKPGECLPTADCAAEGNVSTPNFCPNDPKDVQCCTAPTKQETSETSASSASSESSESSGASCEVYYQTGECLSTTDCAADGNVSTPNFCPGEPEDVQCCTAPPNPEIPESNCEAHVIEAGEIILAEKPNIAHVIWCYADKPGEHGQGLALDFMVGSYNPKGQELAEWVMENHVDLNVMYIIWGQKIWNPSNGEEPTSWDNWRDMDDRGSVTDNHWDHPHVSFNAA